MTRPPINLTAAEWASVQPDGTLWLAREGVSDIPLPYLPYHNPPAEFVQACAPCETCGDQRIAVSGGPGYFKGGKLRHRAGGQTVMEIHCPACRIELVGPCEIDGCRWSPHRTLGYAYAVGQPLPIVQVPFLSVRQTPFDFAHGHTGPLIEVTQNGRVLLWTHHDGGFRDITAAFAHYGPPETLVGRWAIQLRVVGS